MTTTTNHEPSVTDRPNAPVLELRLPVDVDEARSAATTTAVPSPSK